MATRRRRILSQYDLTKLVLRAAQKQVAGLKRITLEAVTPNEDGCNWQLATFAAAEDVRNEAKIAAQGAATFYQLFWNMTPDQA